MSNITKIEKIQGENEEQFLWRIGKMIDTGECDEWRHIVNDINSLWRKDESEFRDESAYRKKYQSAKLFYENVFCEMQAEDYIDELNIKHEKILGERYKFNATKKEYLKKLGTINRFELFYESIRDAILTYPPVVLNETSVNDNSNEYHLLAIADIHAGAKFKVENNEYSIQECKNRFEKLFNKTKKYILDNNITEFNVLELGDSVQGILRMTDLKINEIPVVEAVVFVGRVIAEFLYKLSLIPTLNKIKYYHCPTSNHSQTRPLGSGASELATEDMEFIIFNNIVDALKDNDKVECISNFGKEYISFKIFKHKVVAQHGHKIGNIENALKDLSFKHKKFYKYLFMAHLHAGKEMISGEDNCSTFICPAFIGSCPYSEQLLKGALASCNIYVFNKKHGHVDTKKILLS